MKMLRLCAGKSMGALKHAPSASIVSSLRGETSALKKIDQPLERGTSRAL
jgi:hypothetical protein